MDPMILAYIAGFLDGDGSVFFQIVRRKDYRYGFQIRATVAFYQKKEYSRILEWLKFIFKCGYIRHRKTGISDYTIVEPNKVRGILTQLKPYVRLKCEQCDLGIKILEYLDSVDNAERFLAACRLVDRFKDLNYSKKRTISAFGVERFLKQHKYFTPVETDSE